MSGTEDDKETPDQRRARLRKEHVRRRQKRKIDAKRRELAAQKAQPAPAPTAPAKSLPQVRDICAHRSPVPTGKTQCRTCSGNVEVKVFACAVYGSCSLAKKVDGAVAVCQGCTSRVTAEPS